MVGWIIQIVIQDVRAGQGGHAGCALADEIYAFDPVLGQRTFQRRRNHGLIQGYGVLPAVVL
jgi:hypothetical protein